MFTVVSTGSIFEIRLKSRTESLQKWEGAFLDTGAQKTVFGKHQAQAYCATLGVKFKLKYCNHRFKFGTQIHHAIWQLRIRIPVGPHAMILLLVDIIDANVPLLIGIDVMDRFKFYVHTVTNEVICPHGQWKMPIRRNFGHAYLEWNPSQLIFNIS